MSTNIYLHEFRTRLQSVIIWSLAVMAIIFVYFSLFPSFADQAALLNKMIANFPPDFLAAFGMNGVDMSTVMGFFSFVFLFVQICLAIQAANYGFGLVSIEESELTVDFLLSKPVTRAHILTSKLLAAFTSLTITNIVVWISSFVVISLFRSGREYEVRTLVLLLASIVIFQLFFLTVGVVVSLLVKRVRNVTPYAMALAFGSYVLSAFSAMLGDTLLEKITPFKHFDPNYIIRNGAYDRPLVAISIVIIVVSLLGSYWLYTRRDIPAVA
ncbi:MAG: ABC transporter permease subunit [Chloroflexi bacterium]|nr:ABC transporter permease subunit [Chloroflexota bacterium]